MLWDKGIPQTPLKKSFFFSCLRDTIHFNFPSFIIRNYRLKFVSGSNLFKFFPYFSLSLFDSTILLSLYKYTHTHTHTHTYIYIYIYSNNLIELLEYTHTHIMGEGRFKHSYLC